MLEWNESIVTKMKEGDRLAFEICYRSFSPMIYQITKNIMRNNSAASDLTHDTFIDAFENIDKYKPKKQFSTWLKRIAFNNTMNYLKREKSFQRFVSEVQEGDIPLAMEDVINSSELLDKLFAQLSEKERLVIWLYIVEQFTHTEIAVLLVKSESYSKSIVSRSLKKIQLSQNARGYLNEG